jgi:hypothetical protein
VSRGPKSGRRGGADGEDGPNAGGGTPGGGGRGVGGGDETRPRAGGTAGARAGGWAGAETAGAKSAEGAAGPNGLVTRQGSEVVYRGIRWRNPKQGGMYWYNEGLERWVLWSRGQDAPPVPPRWSTDARPSGGETGGAGHQSEASAAPCESATGSAAARERPGLLRYLPSDAMSRRRPMTSPYRLVPVLIALAIVAVAVYQATRPPAHATQQDVARAMALKGRCLAAEEGGAGAFSARPVSCAGTASAVKVVAVLLPSTHVTCPKGTLLAQVARPGIAGEPFECLEKLHKR